MDSPYNGPVIWNIKVFFVTSLYNLLNRLVTGGLRHRDAHAKSTQWNDMKLISFSVKYTPGIIVIYFLGLIIQERLENIIAFEFMVIHWWLTETARANDIPT